MILQYSQQRYSSYWFQQVTNDVVEKNWVIDLMILIKNLWLHIVTNLVMLG